MARSSRFLVVTTLAGVLAAGSGSALAFGGCDPDGPHGHGGFSPVAAAYRLDDLTADQRKQLDTLRNEMRKQQSAMRDDRDALRDALDDGVDAKTLRPLAEKQGKNVTDAILRQVEMRARVEKILTPDQVKALKERPDRSDRQGRRDFRGMGW